MDKNKTGIPDKYDTAVRYIAGFGLFSFVGYGIVTDSLSTTAIITLSALGTLLVGEEKALSVLGKKTKEG